ncbi:unnamed protein product [Dicrocoelium dendriticum]|nr:unnamed protein product [Dicrocoelium dendriticum]
MPFPCTACRLNGYKWRESLNKHRRSGCCRGPNWENNWKTGVSYTQLSDSVAMNSQHSDSSTRLNGRTTPTSARSKKRPPPPSTTSPPSFKRVRKSAPVCEDSTSRNTFNGKSDFGKDTSLSSVHHDASKIVAAGRLSLLDWDAFIGLSKKRRRLSLLPRGPEDSLCDAFTVGHTLPNGLSRGHLVTGLPPPTQDKVSSALRRRDVSSSVGLSNLINGKKSTDVTVTKHPKAIAGSTITFDESSHMLSETLSPQRSFLCNGYEAKLPDLGFSTSPSINPFPSTCRRLPTDLSNHMNKSHNLGIHPCVSNSSAAIDSLTKQSIPPSTSPVDSDCPCSITTCLHGHKAPNTLVGRKTRRPTPSHMMHDDFDPSDSSVQASLSVVDHTTESMKVVTEGSATKRSPQSRSDVPIEKPSVDQCPSSEIPPSTSPVDSDCPTDSITTYLDGHKASNTPVGRKTRRPTPSHMMHDGFDPSDSSVQASLSVVDHTTGSMKVVPEGSATKRSPQSRSNVAIEKPSVDQCPSSESGGVYDSYEDSDPSRQSYDPRLAGLCPNCSRIFPNATGLNGHLRWCKDKFNLSNATGSQVSSEPDSCSLSQPTSSVSDAHVTGESVDVADSTTGALKRADKNGSAAAHATEADAGPDESEMTEMATGSQVSSDPDSCSLSQPTSSVSDAHVTGESVDVADSTTGALKRADKNGSAAAHATEADALPDESEMTEMPTLDNRQSTPDVVCKSTESNMCVASEGTESWTTAPVTETGIVASPPPVPRPEERSNDTPNSLCEPSPAESNSHSASDSFTSSKDILCPYCCRQFLQPRFLRIHLRKCPQAPTKLTRDVVATTTPLTDTNGDSTAGGATSPLTCPTCFREFRKLKYVNAHVPRCGVSEMGASLFASISATGSQVSSEPDSCSLAQPTSSVSDAHVTGESVDVADSTTGALKRAAKNGSAAAHATVADAGPDESEMTEMPTLDNRQSTPDVVRKSTESNMCVASEGTESWTTAPVTETGIVAILPSTSPVDSDCPSDSITTYLNGHKAPNTPVGRKTRRHTPSHMTHDGFDPSDSSVQASLSVVDHTTGSMKVATEGSATKRSPQSRSNVAIEKPSVDQCPSSEILPSTSPVDSDCPSDSITTYLNGHKAPNTPVGRKTRRHTPSHMTHDGFDPSDSSVQASLSVVDHTTESMKVATEGSATKRSPQSRSNVAIEKPSVDKCPSSELCSTAGVLPSVSVDDPPEDGGGSRQSYDPRFATLCPNCSRMFQNVNCLHGHLRWCKDDSTLATSPSASGAPSNQNADSASVSTISTTHPIELHLGDRAGTPVSSLTDAGTSSSTLPAEDDPTPRLSVTRRSHKRKSHSLSLHRQTSLSEPARSSAFGLTTSSKGTDRDMIDPVGKNSSDIGPAGPCKPIFEAVTLRPRRHSLPAVKRSSSALVQYSCHSEEQFPRLRLRIRMSVDGSTNYSSSPVATTPLSHGATSLNAGTSGSRYHFRSTRLSAESVCSSVDESRSVISDATTLPAVQKATSRKRKTGPYRRRCAWCHVLFHDRRKLYAHKVKCHARPKSLTHSHCVNQMETRNKLGLSIRLWQCACGMKYRSRAVLRAHVAVGCPKSRRFQSIMRVSSQVGCPGCPKNAAPFDSADAVLTHLLSLKPGSGHPYASHGLLSTPRSWPSYLSVPNLGFGCHICGLLLASESRLDKHKRAMHETWLLAEQKNALSPAKATAL